MNWIEEVQEILQGISDESSLWRTGNSGLNLVGLLQYIENQAEEALAAIPEEPEMMKLLRWLKNRAVFYEKAGMAAQSDEFSFAALEDKGIMEIIEREFGYSLEEADSVKTNDSPPQA